MWPPRAGSRRSRGFRTSSTRCDAFPTSTSGSPAPASTRPNCGPGPGLANVHFEGRLDAAHVAALFRGARAVVVPSLVYETFGYVVLEAFAERTPVIVRNLGALPELVEESRGGLVFDSPEGLVAWHGPSRQRRRAARHPGGERPSARRSLWSEAEHLDRYFALIEDRQPRRAGLRGMAPSARPPSPRPSRSGGGQDA